MPVRIRVEGGDRVFDAAPGVDLLEVFQANDHPIATSCGGVASCGLCRVTVVSGKESLVPTKPQELTHLGNVAKVLGLRLACQAQVVGDAGEVVVRVPAVEDVATRKRLRAERARDESRGRGRAPSSVRQPLIEWRPGRDATKKGEPEKG
jgi:ferredoxin